MLLAATNIKLLQRHVYLAKRIIGMNAVAIFKNMVGVGGNGDSSELIVIVSRTPFACCPESKFTIQLHSRKKVKISSLLGADSRRSLKKSQC